MAALPPAPRRLLAALAGAVLLLALPAAAETPRAELGKRLRRFETAWQEADAATRARAVAPMSAAVRGFFSLDLVTAARELDRAWFAVRAAAPPDTAERRTIAFAASAAPLLADAAEETITVSVAPFYEADADGQGGQDATPAAGAATLRLAVLDAAGTTLIREASEKYALTARGFHRVLKLARTIADLDGADAVSRAHIAEALAYRSGLVAGRLAA